MLIERFILGEEGGWSRAGAVGGGQQGRRPSKCGPPWMLLANSGNGERSEAGEWVSSGRCVPSWTRTGGVSGTREGFERQLGGGGQHQAGNRSLGRSRDAGLGWEERWGSRFGKSREPAPGPQGRSLRGAQGEWPGR